MNYSIKEVAERLCSLREDMGVSVDDMCVKTGVSKTDYELAERGETDLSLTFVYKCAESLGVDVIELLTGEIPKLKRYSVIRKGAGLPINRRVGFDYQHLAYLFKDKKVEPLLVTAPFIEGEEDKPIAVSMHPGQEFDYILSGSLKMSIDGKIKFLDAGDSIIYDSGAPHGMVAVNGEKCDILAILIK
jgi:transcriptional regulator with XRE-family HTH domain